MKTEPIEHKFGKPIPCPITFGYHNIFKTQYLRGNLKDVKYGIYEDKFTNKTVSLDLLC